MLKAILIDPVLRIVAPCDVEVDAKGSSYEGLRDLIFKHRDQTGYLQHLSLGASHGIYIDEEGVLTDWDQQAFFYIGNSRGDGLTIAGVAVLVRDTPDGDTADCTLPLELVQSTVTWLHPKEVRVPAPVMTTFEKDGTEKRTLLAGVEEWTYDNQPY